MKPTFSAILVLLGMACSANADVLQVKIQFGSGFSNVAYGTVTVSKSNDQKFSGRTDRFGRVTVKLPHGAYDVQVLDDKRQYRATVTIDGAKGLKAVVVKP